MGIAPPRITAAVRTGDTSQSERAAMLRTPPHILVTTPESLFLLLTAERSRQMLRTVRTVIVDEIHAVIGTRRGAHLALSLERLQEVADTPLLRIGLSATQSPVETVARFLVGDRGDGVDATNPDCAIVDEGHRRALDLALELPKSSLEAVMSSEIWEEVLRPARRSRTSTSHDPRVRQYPPSCRAPGSPPQRPPWRQGSDRTPRKPVERAAARRGSAAEGRHAQGARRHGVAGARNRHRSRRPRVSDWIATSHRDALAACGPIGTYGGRHAEGPGVSNLARRSCRVRGAHPIDSARRAGSHRVARRAERCARSADRRRNRVSRVHGRRAVCPRPSGVAVSGARAPAVRRRGGHARRRLRHQARPAQRADLPRRNSWPASRPPWRPDACADLWRRDSGSRRLPDGARARRHLHRHAERRLCHRKHGRAT